MTCVTISDIFKDADDFLKVDSSTPHPLLFLNFCGFVSSKFAQYDAHNLIVVSTNVYTIISYSLLSLQSLGYI